MRFFMFLVLLFSLMAPLLGVVRLLELFKVLRTPVRAIARLLAGPAAVIGKAQPLRLQEAPLSGRPCAWYSVAVQRVDLQGRGKRTTASGETLYQGASETPLHIDDGTGQLLVALAGAQVDVGNAYTYEWKAGQALPPRLAAFVDQYGLPRGDERSTLSFYEKRIETGRQIYARGFCSRKPADVQGALARFDPPVQAEDQAVLRDGPGESDQVYLSVGDRGAVTRKLMLQSALLLTIGPLVTVTLGYLMFFARE